MFRFPFTITAINWGVGLGALFGVHTYLRTKNVNRAAFWFFSGSFMTGMPIFGFFMFKYTFYSVSLRNFESNQTAMILENDLKREYFIDKLEIKNKEIEDKQLAEKLEDALVDKTKDGLILDSLIREENFD